MWAKKKKDSQLMAFFIWFFLFSLFFFTTCTFYMHGKIGGKEESSIRHREIPLPRLCTPRLCLAVFYPCFLFFLFVFYVKNKPILFFFFFLWEVLFFFQWALFFLPIFGFFGCTRIAIFAFIFLRSLLSIEVYFKLTLWTAVVLTFFLPLLRLLVYSYVLMCPLFFASPFFFAFWVFMV